MIILACNYDRSDGAFWNVWEFIEQRAKHKHFSGLYRGYFFVTDAIFFTQNVDPLSQKRWEFWSVNPLLLLAWSLIPWKTLLIPIPRVVIPDPGPFWAFDSLSDIPLTTLFTTNEGIHTNSDKKTNTLRLVRVFNMNYNPPPPKKNKNSS